MIIKLAIDHLLRRRNHGIGQVRGQFAACLIRLGTGAFDHPKGAHDGNGLFLPPNGEVHQAALCLRAPIAVGRNLQRAKTIGFGAGLGHQRSSSMLLHTK